MKKQGIQKAQIPNPALKEFGKLVGEWKTASTHPTLPDKVLEGKSSIKWIEGGAFLTWHSEIDQKDFPASIVIVGSDDATGELFMLTFDE